MVMKPFKNPSEEKRPETSRHEWPKPNAGAIPRNKRRCEPPREYKRSSLPMDTSSPGGFASALPTSWVEIGYLIEGGSMDGESGNGRSVGYRNPSHLTKRNSYFTSVLTAVNSTHPGLDQREGLKVLTIEFGIKVLCKIMAQQCNRKNLTQYNRNEMGQLS
ncbi:hypothetical protein EVAR_94397_1 [Eumeta japonica]|uniref:Uncharacterized protein n=1 Tax=Eumeta variegata TaxID=151549 RepID=A0A4C1TQ27_EUMVA|nr:hypothetical protein EVAR_94397_1 [Eumeta japonica]